MRMLPSAFVVWVGTFFLVGSFLSLLASSLDFLQGTSEKICFQRFVGQCTPPH